MYCLLYRRAYQFSYHGDSWYESRAFQRLQNKIKQHIPNLSGLAASNSAIGLHLLQNPACAQHYDDTVFSILAQVRSAFHPSAFEATLIKTSTVTLPSADKKIS